LDRSGDEHSGEALRPAGQLVRLVLLSTVLPPFVDKLTLHVATKQRVSVALCGISGDKYRYSIFEPEFTAGSTPNRVLQAERSMRMSAGIGVADLLL
jgi:hypothetical protein